MMIAISFMIFLALVVAWLAAPHTEPRPIAQNGHPAPAGEPAPLLGGSEATA